MEPELSASSIRRSQSSSSEIGDDASIQLTNDEASESKLFAVQLGYWTDPYIGYFVRPVSNRKPPEINRGYWSRVRAVRLLLDQFLDKYGSSAQIINLGAGFDTLFWNLKEANRSCRCFVEMDFPDLTAKKITVIRRHKALNSALAPSCHEEHDHLDLHSDFYHVVGVDLRNCREFSRKLTECNVDFKAPTLFLCECVLVYMTKEQSSTLLSYIASAFSTCCFIDYDQVNVDDKFGHIMQENLHVRGISLAGLGPCISLKSQRERFSDAGWTSVQAWTMNEVWNALSIKERKTIEKIEFLDEVELLTQLFQHYCIVVASVDRKLTGLNCVGFESSESCKNAKC